MRIVPILVACALVLSACGQDNSAPPPEPQIASNVAEQIIGTWQSAPAPNGVISTVTFTEDKKVSTFDNCNAPAGGYKVEGSLVITTDMATALVNCERTGVNLLPKTRFNANINDDQMEMVFDKDTKIIVTRQVPKEIASQ